MGIKLKFSIKNWYKFFSGGVYSYNLHGLSLRPAKQEKMLMSL